MTPDETAYVPQTPDRPERGRRMVSTHNALLIRLSGMLYLLIFILPFLPLLVHFSPIAFGRYTVLGFLKEVLMLAFVSGSVLFLLMRRKVVLINGTVALLGVYFLYGLAHVILTTETYLNAASDFRLIFLNVALCGSIIMLHVNTSYGLDQKLIFRLILYSAVGVALFGLYEKFINPDVVELYRLSYDRIVSHLGLPGGIIRVRIVSTLGNPINLGLFLVVGVTCSIFFLEDARSKVRAFVFSLTILLFTFVLLLTLSRNAYASLFIVFLVYFVYKVFRIKRWQRRVVHIFSALAFVCILLYLSSFIDTELLLARLSHLSDIDVVSQDLRFEHWGQLFSHLSNDPMNYLWGLGLGFSGFAESSYLKEAPQIIENSYLSVLYQMGVIGLVLFLSIIFRFILNTFSLLKSSDFDAQLLGLVCLLYCAVFLFSSLFGDIYIGYPLGVYFWLFFALSEIQVLTNAARLHAPARGTTGHPEKARRA